MTERVCVVGAGRSGAVTAACLADLGHSVCAVDIDEGRVRRLREGRAPFYEPDLDDAIERNLKNGRLSFTTEMAEGVPTAHFVLVCVDTPPGEDGQADLSSLNSAVRQLAPLLADGVIVVTRSTVPIGTNASIAEAIHAENPDVAFDVVSNPEFLREGHAVEDSMKPDRIVVGARAERAAKAVAGLYEALGRPILLADLQTAEMMKYASNTFLAASVSFINEIANICDLVGADVSQVTQALALDHRIGDHAYLSAGIGFGGSCLPKDLRALAATAKGHGYTPAMLNAIIDTNELQPGRVITYLREAFEDLTGLTTCVLGISFKGGTLDLRSSPAVAVIRLLVEEGVRVHAFDPYADDTIHEEVKPPTQLFQDAYSAAAACHALIIATDHSEFRKLDLNKIRQSMKAAVLIDGRNLFEPEAASRAGFSHKGVGRPRRGH